MKKAYINNVALIFLLIIIAVQSPALGAEVAIAKADADSLLARIRAKYEPVFTSCKGVESMREIVLREYDNRTGSLISSARIRLVRRDYFYELPEITVLSYEKEGKTMKPSDYTPRREAPLYPVFDRNGASRYRVEIAGMQTIDGVKCYRVQVTPLKATPRHFRGSLYYRADNLDQVLAEGSGAKLSMGVTGYWMRMRMGTLQGVPVIKGGTVTVTVDVALLYPNRKFVTEIKASNIRLIK